MKKISILLPYKENFSPRYAGAVSLLVNDTVQSSKYKKNTTVFGSTDYKEKFYGSYKNINFNKYFFESSNIKYAEHFLKLENKKKSDLIEIHNRPAVFNYLSNKVDKRKKLISSLRHSYFNNKIQIILSKKLYVNLLNVKDILRAINLIVTKKIIPGNYILKNTIDFNLFNIVSKINKKKNKKLKVKWMSSKIIKEKIYKYKMLSYWKPKFSSLDDLANFIIKN